MNRDRHACRYNHWARASARGRSGRRRGLLLRGARVRPHGVGATPARCFSGRGATTIYGANTWAGAGATPPQASDARLLEWTIGLPTMRVCRRSRQASHARGLIGPARCATLRRSWWCAIPGGPTSGCARWRADDRQSRVGSLGVGVIGRRRCVCAPAFSSPTCSAAWCAATCPRPRRSC